MLAPRKRRRGAGAAVAVARDAVRAGDAAAAATAAALHAVAAFEQRAAAAATRWRLGIDVDGAECPAPVLDFADARIGLAPAQRARLAHDMGIVAPTPVQMQALPCVLAGRDVVVVAETGSGKTLAYALPLLLRLLQLQLSQQQPRRRGGSCGGAQHLPMPPTTAATRPPYAAGAGSASEGAGLSGTLVGAAFGAGAAFGGGDGGTATAAAAAITPPQQLQQRQQMWSGPWTGSAHPVALIVVPTRELALQVAAVVMQLLQLLQTAPGSSDMRTAAPAWTDCRVVLVCGGFPIADQTRLLSHGADLVVATPGRLLDLADRRAIDLSGVCHLVIDEADRMLGPDMEDSLRRITALCAAAPSAGQGSGDGDNNSGISSSSGGGAVAVDGNNNGGRGAGAVVPDTTRQTLLWSATMPRGLERLARSLVADPLLIRIMGAGRVRDGRGSGLCARC